MYGLERGSGFGLERGSGLTFSWSIKTSEHLPGEKVSPQIPTLAALEMVSAASCFTTSSCEISTVDKRVLNYILNRDPKASLPCLITCIR